MRDLYADELEAVCGGVRAGDASIWPRTQSAPDREVELTPRQAQCLAWVAAGKTSAEIGAIVGLSPLSVDTYVKAACKALGVRTRCEAATVAQTRFFLDLDRQGHDPEGQSAEGEIS